MRHRHGFALGLFLITAGFPGTTIPAEPKKLDANPSTFQGPWRLESLNQAAGGDLGDVSLAWSARSTTRVSCFRKPTRVFAYYAELQGGWAVPRDGPGPWRWGKRFGSGRPSGRNGDTPRWRWTWQGMALMAPGWSMAVPSRMTRASSATSPTRRRGKCGPITPSPP